MPTKKPATKKAATKKAATKKPAPKKPAPKKPAPKKPARVHGASTAKRAVRSSTSAQRDEQADLAAVDAHLRALPPAQGAALQSLRATIARLVPRARQRIAYRMPAFYLDGRPLVGFDGFAAHCSLFAMSGTVQARLAGALAGFSCSKGTIRFTPEAPLPASLVEKLVRARLAELQASRR